MRPQQNSGVHNSGSTTTTAPLLRRRSRRRSRRPVHVVVGLARLPVVGAGRVRRVSRPGQRRQCRARVVDRVGRLVHRGLGVRPGTRH